MRRPGKGSLYDLEPPQAPPTSAVHTPALSPTTPLPSSPLLVNQSGSHPPLRPSLTFLRLPKRSPPHWTASNNSNPASQSSGGRKPTVKVSAGLVSSGGSQGGPAPGLSSIFWWLQQPLAFPGLKAHHSSFCVLGRTAFPSLWSSVSRLKERHHWVWGPPSVQGDLVSRSLP